MQILKSRQGKEEEINDDDPLNSRLTGSSRVDLSEDELLELVVHGDCKKKSEKN